MKPVFASLVLWGLTLAQTTPPVPPPRPPEEPRAATARIEVVIEQTGKGLSGVVVYLARSTPGRQLVPVSGRLPVRVTNAEGRASWEGLKGVPGLIQIRNPRDGFSLSVPLTPEFLERPLVVGEYRIVLRVNP